MKSALAALDLEEHFWQPINGDYCCCAAAGVSQDMCCDVPVALTSQWLTMSREHYHTLQRAPTPDAGLALHKHRLTDVLLVY